MPRLAQWLGRAPSRRRPADGKDGRPVDRYDLFDLQPPDELGPAAECRPARAAAPSAVDGDGSGQLVLVWATTVRRSRLRLACVVSSAMERSYCLSISSYEYASTYPGRGRGCL